MSECRTTKAVQCVVGYRRGLDEEIFSFHRSVYPHRPTSIIAPCWRWKFLESARRLGIANKVWLYQSSEGVIGHLGVIPVTLLADGTEHITGWFVDFVVAESVRGTSVGPRLFYTAWRDLPFCMSLGQKRRVRSAALAVGWKQVCPMPVFAMMANPSALLAGKIRWAIVRRPIGAALSAGQRLLRFCGRRRLDWEPEVRRIDRFDESHDHLWREVQSDFRCAVVRDASYLNWKYVDQPGQDFIRLEVRKNGKVVSIIVVTVRQARRRYLYDRGIIVDLVLRPTDHEIVWATLEAARRELCASGVALIECHLISELLTPQVCSFGFVRRRPERYLLVSPGDVPDNVAAAVLQRDSWFATYGDSDVDRPW